MSAAQALEQAAIARVERLLHRRIGLDVTTVGRSLVERAVRRRMDAVRIGETSAYVARLDDDEQELQELVEAVVVPETYFFREPEALDELARRIAAAGSASAQRPLRVLSAPCSTGEEPYSIVMTMLAAGLPAAALAVDAVDVSHEAIRRARRAEYRGSSFRGAFLDWRPWFHVVGADRVLHPSVRDVVRIEQANLLDPAFRPPRPEYDVVFCRNLLIYFDVDTQAQVLGTLTALLAPGGMLVVGAADIFAVRRAGFVPVEGAERAFLFRLGATAPALDGIAAAAIPARRRRPLVRPAAVPPARAVSVPPRRLAPEADSATPAVEGVVAAITRLADDGRLAEAVQAGEAASIGPEATAELFALLGTSYAALGDATRAERCYRRALYLDPEYVESLMHLALLLEAGGSAADAARLRARARRTSVREPGGSA